MTSNDSRFAKLIEIADETSSERRRAILREVTDAFVEDNTKDSAAKVAQLDQVLSNVVQEFSREIRTELAARLGPSRVELRRTAESLAADDITVAHPILEHSTLLSEDFLVQVVKQKTQDHLLAITRRADLSETLSHALVERGDDRVVVSLLKNATAKIGRPTFETVTQMAQTRPELHAPLARRADTPVDLLSEIYLEVGANLRAEILARYSTISPEELDHALERCTLRLARTARRPALTTAKARARVADYRSRNELKPELLIRLFREGETSRACFVEAFAALADVESDLINRTTLNADIDALALLCRAANFSRPIFVTLALLLIGAGQRMNKAEEFGAIYEKVPVAAAQRAVRFWKVRSGGEEKNHHAAV